MACERVSAEQHAKSARKSTLLATYSAGVLQGQKQGIAAREDAMRRNADEQLLRFGIDRAAGEPEQTLDDDVRRGTSLWSERGKSDQAACACALLVSRTWLKRRYARLQRECRVLEDHAAASQEAHTALIHEHERLDAQMRQASQLHDDLVVRSYARARREALLWRSVPYTAWGTAWFCMWASRAPPPRVGVGVYMWTCPLLAVCCVCGASALATLVPRWVVSRTQRLRRFYAKWNPAKASPRFVSDKCAKYARDVDGLFKVLVCKYGPEPDDQLHHQLLAFVAIVVVTTMCFVTSVYRAHRSTTPPMCADPNASTLR